MTAYRETLTDIDLLRSLGGLSTTITTSTALITEGVWFVVTPMPYNAYEIAIKNEPGGRRIVEDHCPSCSAEKGGIHPPHFASPRCESGRHNHCTCDTCF